MMVIEPHNNHISQFSSQKMTLGAVFKVSRCNCWANIYLIYTLFEHQHRTSGANDHYGLPSKQPEQDTTSTSCKNHFSQTKPTFSFVFKQTSKGNIRRK